MGKTASIHIRLNETEKENLDFKAKSWKKSISDYVRDLINSSKPNPDCVHNI